jgi:hypothetical protein
MLPTGADGSRDTEAAVSTKDLVEARTAREVVAFCERHFGVTQYNVVAALRGMKMAGRLVETGGKLYLQRGLGFG